MCGFIIAIGRPGVHGPDQVEHALSQLAHRGPDASGLTLERIGDWEIWLGHQRLAVQDLDARADQPMRIEECSIVYNGEIYNSGELRGALQRHDWFSSSDTEVLLATLRERGPSSLRDVNGMFAFGFLDRRTERLTLARDRLGQKPLYVYQDEERFIAASELKAIYSLVRASRSKLSRDEQALAHYHWLGYLPFDYTPFREIRRFRAASWASYRLEPGGIELDESACFWDPFSQIDRSAFRTLAEAREACGALLDEATAIRTVSDRPLGVFLSGGVDSSLVASSLARAQKDVTAVSVRSPGFDESEEAERTAKLLGLPFLRIELSQNRFDAQRTRLGDVFDEPLADQSAIPLMALCEEAVNEVTVALTGDGGDEPFVGYPWHGFPEQLWQGAGGRALRNLPGRGGLRSVASAFIRSNAGEQALRLLERAAGRNPETAGAKAFIVEELLKAESPEQLYDVLHSAQPPSSLPQSDAALLRRPLLQAAKEFYPEYSWEALDGRPLSERLAALDLVTYLRDGVLVKADRSSMAYSMELRSPFLDHRLVELGLSLPLEYKTEGASHKRILRELLRTRLGAEVADRPKSGFGVTLPEDLPDAPTERGRWVKQCERVWEQRWGASLPESR